MIALGQAPLLDYDQSACQSGDRPTHCEEPPRFFDLRNFGPRVEANEGGNEHFAGDLIPTSRLIELCK